ncbi:MAG: BspA family leucine-rich repeat surface protein [Bacteroidaceae bacterium]|nr:BspA family leucine-rich repeat surface protein [Bacteroidaceae bacterium]
MKKLYQKLFLLTGLILLGAAKLSAQEAYAVFTANDSTLTFYYDFIRESRTGDSYLIDETAESPLGYDQTFRSSVYYVVFNSSFGNYLPKSTHNWFRSMRKLVSINGIQYLNTYYVKDMALMFDGCWSLTHLDLSGFKTSNVTTMRYMFDNCRSLTSLDLSSFNTAKLEEAYHMFYSCGKLKTIYVGDGWDMTNVTSSKNMFRGCTNLVGGKGTTYDPNNYIVTYAHIDQGPTSSSPGYLTDISKRATYAILKNDTLTFYYDGYKALHTEAPYTLNTGTNSPGWYTESSTIRGVVFDPSFVDARPTTTARWFYGMVNLTTIKDLQYLNTRNVTSMYYMFSECSSLTSLDLSHFDVYNVTNMSFMFQYCSSLTSVGKINDWYTANLTNVADMFCGCSSLTSLNLNGWYTGKVTDMSYMFFNCTRLKDIHFPNWNTANVTNMSHMFYDCRSLTSLDLSYWNTGKVTDMNSMFEDCSALKTIYVNSIFNTEAVTNDEHLFYGCDNLVGMAGTKYNIERVGKDYAVVDGVDGNTGYFSALPYIAYNNNTLMFRCDGKMIGNGWGTLYYLNSGSTKPYWQVYYASDITKVVFDPSFIYARPTTTYAWFEDMTNLTFIEGLEYLNTSEVTTMRSMFSKCEALKAIDVSHFDTRKVTDMSYMFNECTAVEELDLTSFDLHGVTDISYMFYYNPSLYKIYVAGEWDMSNVQSSSWMFLGCSSIVGGNGTQYDYNYLDNTYARIDAPGTPGYFTLKLKQGDVNGDGAVNVTDVTMLVSIILGNTPSIAAADVNDDTQVNVTDVTALVSIILGQK